MSINCPLKTSVLYKELQVITNNNELVSNHMYGVITQLQDQGLLSKHRYKTKSGEWIYTIPKLTETEKAIAKSLEAGTIKGEKDTSKATELDKYLTIKEIDWIKVEEKDNFYSVTIVEPDLSKPLSIDEPINLLEELEGVLTEEEINQALLDYQDEREVFVTLQQLQSTEQRALGQQLDLFRDTLTEEQIEEAFINEVEQEKVLTSEFVAQVAEKLLNQLNLSNSVINFVSTEEAIELTKDMPNPYNGQPAFYLNGNIYFVNGQMTFTTSVHEISHIFIKAIRYQNPELFETLYNDLKAIPEMMGMLEEIKKELATTEVTGDVKEEAIVRFFTETVKNDIIENPDALDTNFSNSKEKKSLLQKILYAIKKLIRSVFDKGVTIEKLNKNTTLKELSELLISEGFSVNMETVSKSDVVNYINNKQAFEEDIRNQLQGKFKEGDSELVKVLFETVNESSKIYQNTLLDIKNNNDLNALQRVFQEGYDEYMRITGTKNITQRTKAETINLIINKELEETVEFARVATDLQQIFATQ
jgi:ankyrin repeat protein